MAKSSHKNRKRAGKRQGVHPMSAGPGRQPNGRTRRATTVAERMERCGPTPETVKRIAESGPTDMIQRAVAQGKLTQIEGQGLEELAGIRRTIGVAEYNPPTVLGKMEPHGGGVEITPERLARAKAAYVDACAVLDPIPGAFDACVSVCDNRRVCNMEALSAGARALASLFIAGQKVA